MCERDGEISFLFSRSATWYTEGRTEREMGNLWMAQFDSSSSSSSPTGPSSPGIAQNASNEGTHTGTGSAFSSSLDEVSPNGQILPITRTSKIFSFAALKKATRKFSLDTILGEGGFRRFLKGNPQNISNEGTHSGTGSARSSRLDEVSPYGQILPITPTLRIFSFAELKKATSMFSPNTVLGDGGFGRVFKGWIDEKTFAPTKAGSGMAIAVKIMDSENLHGREQWLTEVNILGSLSHPNIVRLLGHCETDKELLLVYDIMPRGSLENHLFSKGSAFQSLSWSIRLKIAIGVARGLAFLHCSERKIIHRNLTPYNVWIDSNYNAKISNFGIAMNGPPHGENSHVSTFIMGTIGYIAPEYLATGHLYVKSDVYSFGVVLLVMLSGMRAFDAERPSGQQNLVEWAKPYLSDQRKVSRLMDRRLEGYYPYNAAAQTAQLILKCLIHCPRNRPSMTEVAEALEKIHAPKHPLGPLWQLY